MSHTTRFKSSFNNPDVLQRAVLMLQHEMFGSVRCQLLQNAVPRMYFKDQFQKDVKKGFCDYVLKLEDCPYDIGFLWNAETQSYELIFDEWADNIAKVLGLSSREYNLEISKIQERMKTLGQPFEEPNTLGRHYTKLTQAYALAATQFGIANAPHIQVQECAKSETSQSIYLVTNAIL